VALDPICAIETRELTVVVPSSTDNVRALTLWVVEVLSSPSDQQRASYDGRRASRRRRFAN
jgi:hypothetical protein